MKLDKKSAKNSVRYWLRQSSKSNLYVKDSGDKLTISQVIIPGEKLKKGEKPARPNRREVQKIVDSFIDKETDFLSIENNSERMILNKKVMVKDGKKDTEGSKEGTKKDPKKGKEKPGK